MRFSAPSAFACVWFGWFGTSAEAALAEDAPEWQKTPSGLEYRVIARGPEGPMATADTAVRVDYTGKLADGRVFDSSRMRGVPGEFPVGGVIKGWTEGLQLMRRGDRFEFRIPPNLAYGDQGAGGVIPPGATLTFDVELIDIFKPLEFAKIDDAAAKTTKSGMRYQIVKEGTGELLSNKAVELRFALFDADGKPLTNSFASGPLLGNGETICSNLGAEMFLDLPSLVRVGTEIRCEVPASHALAEQTCARMKLAPDSLVSWLILVTSATEIPAFIKPDESKLQTTPSGLKYQVLSRGSDPAAKQPKLGDGVVVDYAGWLVDGTPFDSSYARATRYTTEVKRGPGGVIEGWIEGVQLMKEGDRFLLVVPPSLAYGASGTGKVPPDATLVFLIELHMVP